MNSDQIKIVKTSFASLLPKADAIAISFYDKLFELAPEVRRLFKDDLSDQRHKLMLTLATVVGELHRLDTILPTVKALAVRHKDYGARDEHYAVVGDALIHALAHHAGPAFGDPERRAWTAAYAGLSGIMLDAARAA